MDNNTKLGLSKYLKFKGFTSRWANDYAGYDFCYNLNIHHEDPESNLNLCPKNFREIAEELIKSFDGYMHLQNKGFLLSLHTVNDPDGYQTTFLYYNPESNGNTISYSS